MKRLDLGGDDAGNISGDLGQVLDVNRVGDVAAAAADVDADAPIRNRIAIN